MGADPDEEGRPLGHSLSTRQNGHSKRCTTLVRVLRARNIGDAGGAFDRAARDSSECPGLLAGPLLGHFWAVRPGSCQISAGALPLLRLLLQPGQEVHDDRRSLRRPGGGAPLVRQ